MAESRALTPKAPRPASPRPAAGAPAPAPPSTARSAPPPFPEADLESTAATDIIAGPGARKADEADANANQRVSGEAAKSTGNQVGIHAVPTAGDHIGPYVMTRLLGSGGMGLVVAATHEETGAEVAVKLLRPKAAGDKIHAERFAREARAIVKIKSPHVVKVLDAGTLESDAPYIVMEYLVGRDLSQTIREDGPLTVMQAADVMLQVCDAVASAHAVGVIHRDLKPSNFFLTPGPDGRPKVKVLDFGIAKAIGTDGVVDPNLTETQAVFGSPTYMSPEQIRSAKHVDHRSDIWSIGVALYEITTGRLPFAADNVAGLLASIVADPPYYPRGFVPSIPIVFEELLLACLHKDAKQRVQNAGDLGVALAPFCTPGPETDALVQSIKTLSPPTGQPFPGETGPRLPQGFQSSPSFQPYAPPPQHHTASTPSWPGHPPEDQRRSGGVAFGSTGSDLHAALPKPIGGKIIATLGIALAVAVLLLGVIGGAWYVKRQQQPIVTQPPTQPSATAIATTSASVPAPIPTPAVSVSASPVDSTVPDTSAKPPKTKPTGGRHNPAGHPTGNGGTRPPVDPTDGRF